MLLKLRVPPTTAEIKLEPSRHGRRYDILD
jgi:hypothetical protein